jgi:DNA-binding MarR family transcriptional regulator
MANIRLAHALPSANRRMLPTMVAHPDSRRNQKTLSGPRSHPRPPLKARPKPQRARQNGCENSRMSAHALDLDRYIPAYLTYLAGKISSGASAIYRPRFGVGITDWRIMALLAAEPWITAGRICESTWLDKAAVSRSVRELHGADIIEVRPDKADQRRQFIALTPKGLSMHDRIVKLAIARERKLLEGFSASEREALLAFLVRLQSRVQAANSIVEPGASR